jgi:hypothetical protein
MWLISRRMHACISSTWIGVWELFWCWTRLGFGVGDVWGLFGVGLRDGPAFLPNQCDCHPHTHPPTHPHTHTHSASHLPSTCHQAPWCRGMFPWWFDKSVLHKCKFEESTDYVDKCNHQAFFWTIILCRMVAVAVFLNTVHHATLC